MVRAFVVIEEIPERFNFEPEDGPYESMYCEMCRQAHTVNIKTGKVLAKMRMIQRRSIPAEP
jgi:hypothetical protein